MLLPQEHTVMVRQTSKWGQIFLLSLVGIGATAIATAWLYRIDEVITVNGRLVTQTGGVEVKSPTTGQLKQILIENGQEVTKGQPLFEYDVKNARAEEINLRKQFILEKTRLEDQLRSNSLRQQTLSRNIDLSEKILGKLVPLREKGAISELQVLQQKNSIETQRDELIQIKTKREELITNNKSRNAEIEKKINQIESNLRNEILYAPVSGIIFDVKPDNDKYVTLNAEPLLKIVPKGELGAEVNITNRDIGFIKKGQKVKVRIDSFPYTEYGEINGKISSIGADALAPTELVRSYHFPVTIAMKKSKLQTKEGMIIPLQSGMTITSNLKLRDRRLIELLGDLFNNRSESLKRLRQP